MNNTIRLFSRHRKLMKTVLVSVLLSFFSISMYSQDKYTWDNNKCDYTNHTWHFHWNLDKSLEWELHQGNEEHTVFRALSPYGFMVFMNIVPFQSKDQGNIDFWSERDFNRYKKILSVSWKIVEERTGGKITPIKVEKCRFFGEHAVKVLTRTDIIDDVRSEISYGLTYSFHKDGSTWSASVKVCKDIWDIIGEEGLKEMFINLGPNAKFP